MGITVAQTPTHLSLFSGIGGLDLAAERAGFQTVGQCEWADYPTKVLEKHWPDVARWRDIRTLTQESFYERTGLRTVDVISGGFPCQPFSCAGKRRGKEDDRYLWPEMLRVIQELRPTWVVGENVANIVGMALDQVLSDLEGQGYKARAFIFPACAVDAPHRRDRCAIVAYTNSERCEKFKSAAITGEEEPVDRSGFAWYVAHTQSEQGGRIQQPGLPADSGASGQAGRATMAYAERLQGQYGCIPEEVRGWESQTKQAGLGGCYVAHTDDRREPLRRDRQLPAVEGPGGSWTNHAGGTQEHGSEERRTAQPGLGRGHDGLSDWLDGVRTGWADGTWESGIPRIAADIPDRPARLKCLGNAVVPQQFYPIFQAIHDIEEATHG